MRLLLPAIALVNMLSTQTSATSTAPEMVEINVPIRHGQGNFITEVPVLGEGYKYFLSPVHDGYSVTVTQDGDDVSTTSINPRNPMDDSWGWGCDCYDE
jgi:hypothetical protein